MVGSIYGYTSAYRFTLVDYNVQGWHTYEYRNWQAVDALLNSFVQLLNFKGVWQNNTTYAINDIAADSSDSLLYKSTAAHTSPTTGSFSAARSASPGQWTTVDQSAFDATSNKLMRRVLKLFSETQAMNANTRFTYLLGLANATATTKSASLANAYSIQAQAAANGSQLVQDQMKRTQRKIKTFNPANMAFYSQVFS